MENRKKLFSFLLAAAMLFSTTAINADTITPAANYADDAQVSLFSRSAVSGECGIDGDNLTWKYANGILRISGNGEMDDYGFSNYKQPWISHIHNIDSVVIENGVTSIGDSAFQYCDSLENISLPDSLSSIGESAFENCNSLESITIPHSVSSIGDSAFQHCISLENISLPDSLSSIGDSAFGSCYGLGSITIPHSVSYIGQNAFDNFLKEVYYKGTEEEWKNIHIDYFNDPLTNAKIHYESIIQSVAPEPTAKPALTPDPKPTAEPTAKPTAEPAEEPQPIVPTETVAPVCNDFAEKVTVDFSVDKNGKAALNINLKNNDDSAKIETTAYAAYFDSDDNLTEVQMLTPDGQGNYSFNIKNGNYKIMLWDDFKPIINAIKQPQ